MPNSRHDAIDDGTLGISVVLNKRPFPLSQVEFSLSIKLAIRGVGAEPISEHHHSTDLRTAIGKRVEVDVRVGPLEHPVLVPVSLPPGDANSIKLEPGEADETAEVTAVSATSARFENKHVCV